MAQLIITRVSRAGAHFLTLHLRNRGASDIGLGTLRYDAIHKSGDVELHATPNGMTVEAGATMEIVIEVEESVKSLRFIDYVLQSGDSIPVPGRIDAGFWRWKLVGTAESE